jgi:hypothetical protein
VVNENDEKSKLEKVCQTNSSTFNDAKCIDTFKKYMRNGSDQDVPTCYYYWLICEIICMLMFFITAIFMLSSKKFKRYPYPSFAYALLATSCFFYSNID